MLNNMFKSVLDNDRSPVVICDLEHIIVYINSAAINKYSKYGGEDLVGKSLLNCHNEHSREIINRDDSAKLIGYYEKHEYRNQETAKLYDFSKSLV